MNSYFLHYGKKAHLLGCFTCFPTHLPTPVQRDNRSEKNKITLHVDAETWSWDDHFERLDSQCFLVELSVMMFKKIAK